MSDRLAQKVCVVTGGGSGIGRAFCEAVAKAGAKVAVADINVENATTVADAIVAQNGEALAVAVDVTERASVQAMMQKILETFGKLDVIFANAGIHQPQDFLATTEDNWNRIMTVNGLGAFLTVQESAKVMIEQGTKGKIIVTSSIAGRSGQANGVSYCASKAAAISIMQSAARALASHGITVNSLAPGFIDTPMMDTIDQAWRDMGKTETVGAVLQQSASQSLLGRPGTTQDLVGTAVFLASDDSDFMTGQVVTVDGGVVLI